LLATVRTVSAKAVELILLRQLLSRLPLPASLVDADGVVVYFNPATERLLGWSLAEMGEFPLSHVPELIGPRRPDDSRMEVGEMPIAVALHDRRPQQYRMTIHSRDGTPHRIVTTAIPLDGQGGTLLGAMNFFWEEGPGDADAADGDRADGSPERGPASP
jgi:PAS domain S-box-containing protein